LVFKSDLLAELFSRVLNETGVSRREIVSRFKERPVLEARFAVVMALTKRGYSSYQIGDILGKHHSTIWSAIRVAQKWMNERPDFRALVEKVSG
jgi:chromosomal replication initiation ATPase DnaA